MGCICSRKDAIDDSSYVYDTDMPTLRKGPHSVMSKGYFQKYVKRDGMYDAAYTEMVE